MSQKKRAREGIDASDKRSMVETKSTRRRHGPPAELIESLTSSLNESWQELSGSEAEVLRKMQLTSDSIRFIKAQTAIMLAGLVEHGKVSRKPARRRDGGTPEGKRSSMTPEKVAPKTDEENTYVPPPPPDEALPTFPMDIPFPYGASTEETITTTEQHLRPTQRAAVRRAARERREAAAKFRWPAIYVCSNIYR